mmetsp:Transcript_24900/g.62075  ORF Transcript_24900/g.62075 Transcript_24900/m.62075 type:complete len:201 (+) Transcript_24900:317-919(+)
MCGAQQQLGRTIPQGDHPIGHGLTVGGDAVDSQAKVCDLQIALIVDEQVTTLDVAVHHPARVAVLERAEELHHKVLDLAQPESPVCGFLRRRQQPCQVVLHVFKHEVHGALLAGARDGQQLDDVGMVELAQNDDLARHELQARAVHALQSDLLQCHQAVSVQVHRLVHGAVRALAHLGDLLVRHDEAGLPPNQRLACKLF